MMSKGIYTSRYLFIQGKEVVISTHAAVQAMRRRIHPEMVEATVLGGVHKHFGKRVIKFIRPFKNRTVICVGDDEGLRIVIKTIEWGNRI
jgi:hypothetical protein